MCALSLVFTYLYCIYVIIIFNMYMKIFYLKELAHAVVGSSWVNVKSERQACRLEPQAGADPDVLRQNFFLLQEASGFALQAFDWTRPLQCGG